MQRVGYWLGIILAVVIILVTPWAVYQAAKLFIAASTTAKLGVITATLSVVAIVYNNSRQQAREIKSRHFAEKRQAYQKFFDFMFDMFEAQSDETTIDDKESIKRTRSFVKDIMVWGSPETINQYNIFIRNSVTQSSDDPKAVMSNVEALMRSLRKDLGHDDRKLEKLGLSKLLIKGEEHGALG